MPGDRRVTPVDRSHAEALDAGDPLADFRDRFVDDDPATIYLNGNSLGRLPKATSARLADATARWGSRLVSGWTDWLDIPTRVGDALATGVLGARAGEVALSDSTTVNLYKLASAAVDSCEGRRVIVTDEANFPTDRYVLDGVARRRGLEVRVVPTEQLSVAVDRDVALVSLSHVAYRSGALADLAGITAASHRAGALVLWDLSHSAGVVPVGLAAADVDLAVGCTYKYLNAGPGAPAFLYARSDLHHRLRQPIWGWFGQRDQFAMSPVYDPEPDVRRFLTGTPSVLGIVAVEEGVRLTAEAGIDRVRAKSMMLTDLVVDLYDAWLAPHGFVLGSPRKAEQRGSHVSLCHPDAQAIGVSLAGQGVVADFRAPDTIRLGLAPLSTRFVDVWDALERLRWLIAGAK